MALIALSGPLAAQSMFDADDGMGVQPLTGMPGSMSADSGVTALAPESVALGSAPVADRTPSPQNPMVVGPDADVTLPAAGRAIRSPGPPRCWPTGSTSRATRP